MLASRSVNGLSDHAAALPRVAAIGFGVHSFGQQVATMWIGLEKFLGLFLSNIELDLVMVNLPNIGQIR